MTRLRDTGFFAIGVGLIFWEFFFASILNPVLLLCAGAFIGLPIFLANDQENQRRLRSQERPTGGMTFPRPKPDPEPARHLLWEDAVKRYVGGEDDAIHDVIAHAAKDPKDCEACPASVRSGFTVGKSVTGGGAITNTPATPIYRDGRHEYCVTCGDTSGVSDRHTYRYG